MADVCKDVKLSSFINGILEFFVLAYFWPSHPKPINSFKNNYSMINMFDSACVEITIVRLLNDTEIAKAKRDFELKKAAYDVEVQTKV